MSRLLLAALAGGLLAVPATAATVVATPGSGQRAVTISSVDPVGQSFTAVDTFLTSFGFQFNALNAGSPNDPITLTIRAGEGLAGAAIATRTFTLPSSINTRDAVWFDVDFTGTALTVGTQYTALLTTSGSPRNALVYGPDININTGVPLGGDAYAGGRFISANPTQGGAICTGTTSICDANFRFSGVTPAAVPEPATWAMMIGGFGLVGGALRRRGLRIVAA